MEIDIIKPMTPCVNCRDILHYRKNDAYMEMVTPALWLTKDCLKDNGMCPLCVYVSAALDYFLPGYIPHDPEHSDRPVLERQVFWQKSAIRFTISIRGQDVAKYSDWQDFERFRCIALFHNHANALVIPGLPYGNEVAPNVDDEHAWSFAEQQMKTCLENHAKCRERKLYGSYTEQDGPKRLLLVDDEQVRLVNVKPDGLTWDKYATLSYCWGGYQGLILNAASEERLYTGIPLKSLPAVYRDFFQVLRRWDVDYAWIDALCIRQDDSMDWNYHASFMGLVYERAYFTVAAVSSSNPTVPFLGPDAPNQREELRSVLLDPYKRNKNSPSLRARVQKLYWPFGDDGPLDKRAWAMQESLLSRRVVRFTSKGVQWLCLEHQCLETQPQGMPTSNMRWNSDVETAATEGWPMAVFQYTSRFLTVSGDRLPAMSGIAAKFGAKIGSDYLAGLWRSHLPYHMIWKILMTPEQEKRAYSDVFAPSWSWASVPGAANWPYARRHEVQRLEFVYEVLGAKCDPSTSNPHGWVHENATVLLRGPVFWTTLHQSLKDDGRLAFQISGGIRKLTVGMDLAWASVFPDCVLVPTLYKNDDGSEQTTCRRALSNESLKGIDVEAPMDVLCLVCSLHEEEGITMATLLCLAPSSLVQSHYQRVGVITSTCKKENLTFEVLDLCVL